MKRNEFFLLCGLIFLMWGDLANSTALVVFGFIYVSSVFVEPLLKLAYIYVKRRRRT